MASSGLAVAQGLEPSTPTDDDGALLLIAPPATPDAVTPAPTPKVDCPDAGLAGARASVLEGNLDAAADTLEQRRACDPATASLNSRETFLLASIERERGNPERALELLAGARDHVVADHVTMLQAATMRDLGMAAGAAEIYESVIADRHSPRYHEAVVEQGVAWFEAGLWDKALDKLDYALDTYTEHPNYERLLLLRAKTLLTLNQPKRAAVDLDRVIWEWPSKQAATEAAEILASEALEGVERPSHDFDSRFERARQLRRFRHWALAEAEFEALLEQVTTDKGHSFAENRVWMQLALNYYNASRYDEALPILRRLAELHDKGKGDGTTRSYVYTLIVRCEAWSGRFDEALAALNTRDQGISKKAQQTNLAGFYEDNGRYDKALRNWDQLLTESGKRTWHYAFLLYKAGHYTSAIRKLDWLAGRASGTKKMMYMYWKGRALQKKGSLEDAVEVFAAVHAKDPLRYYAIQAANRRAEIEHHLASGAAMLADAGDDVGPVFANAGDIVASGSETSAGIGADSEVVPRIISPMLQTFASPGGLNAGIYGAELDREVAAMRAPTVGDVAVADVPEETTPVVETGRAQIYWGRAPFDDLQFATNDVAETAARQGKAGTLMPAYTAGEATDGALAAAAETHGHLFPRLHRASFLYDVGLETDARWEIRDVGLEYRGLKSKSRKPALGKPYQLGFKADGHYIDNRREEDWGTWGIRSSRLRYPVPQTKSGKLELSQRQRAIVDAVPELEESLAMAFKEAGDFHLVRKMAFKTGFAKTDPLDPENKEVWMEGYPRAFPRLVQENAAKQGLNPYLMWSLMTVESTYNPDSISYADARGLLQVIPKTGNKVAATLEVDDYGHYQLLDERVSIRFGTWYFSQLVKKFHGQELFAIAGYNGGPHNVARWLTSRAHALDMDEFVETIPFDQARGYTKKVLRHAALYQRIYENNPVTYVGNDIEPIFRAHPNY